MPNPGNRNGNRTLTGLALASGSVLLGTVLAAVAALATDHPAPSAQIRLPDQRLCTYVGPQPRQSEFDTLLSYDCGDGLGIQGAVTVDGTQMILDRERRASFRQDPGIRLETVRFLIAEIRLADGTLCRHAGDGATLAFDGKRLNYTCGRSIGLIGDLAVGAGGVFEVEKANLSGTSLVSSEVVTIHRLGAVSR